MDEWEMKYKALLAAIDDKALIDNAEALVNLAIKMGATTQIPTGEAFWHLMAAIAGTRPIVHINVDMSEFTQGEDR